MIPCKTADRRVDDPAVAANDVFFGKDPSLLFWVTRSKVSGGVDDAPPWDLHIGVPDNASNETRHLRIAGYLGNIAIRGDFTCIERHQDIDDPTLAFGGPFSGRVRIGIHGAAATRMFAASYRPNFA